MGYDRDARFMMHTFRSELLLLVQSSIGWAILAVRATDALQHRRAGAAPVGSSPDAPIRLRATVTIDIDAADPSEADRETAAVQQQFQALRRRFPHAALNVRRRKPRVSRRPATPTIVVTPYADD